MRFVLSCELFFFPLFFIIEFGIFSFFIVVQFLFVFSLIGMRFVSVRNVNCLTCEMTNVVIFKYLITFF